VGARPILIEKLDDYSGKVHPRKSKVRTRKIKSAN
jgi:hypothetical protein